MQSPTPSVYFNPNTGKHESHDVYEGYNLIHGYEHQHHHTNDLSIISTDFIFDNSFDSDSAGLAVPPHALQAYLQPNLRLDDLDQDMINAFSHPDRSDDQYFPPSPSNSISTSSTPSTSTSSRPKKNFRRNHTARNRQATTSQADLIKAKLNLGRRTRREALPTNEDDLGCPVTHCRYRQLNGRMPDLRRHMRTHLRGDKKICCKGIRFEDWMRYDPLCSCILEYGEPYDIPGEEGSWIGGCSKTFSRADALKRHLKNHSCLRA